MPRFLFSVLRWSGLARPQKIWRRVHAHLAASLLRQCMGGCSVGPLLPGEEDHGGIPLRLCIGLGDVARDAAQESPRLC
ncbi:hypothetical protein TNCT_78581 [Trichonephila clavata]|uniref:Uncharacterized protein n=1 Tax=Trichonephila clavata TaxID=2740835 RepID=A0A8X6JQZ8_TRICU|nr:hypothetical protein TNCT_78581 [Trichonephila clavata]